MDVLLEMEINDLSPGMDWCPIRGTSRPVFSTTQTRIKCKMKDKWTNKQLSQAN